MRGKAWGEVDVWGWGWLGGWVRAVTGVSPVFLGERRGRA